jgi:hypothetical protein
METKQFISHRSNVSFHADSRGILGQLCFIVIDELFNYESVLNSYDFHSMLDFLLTNAQQMSMNETFK